MKTTGGTLRRLSRQPGLTRQVYEKVWKRHRDESRELKQGLCNRIASFSSAPCFCVTQYLFNLRISQRGTTFTNERQPVGNLRSRKDQGRHDSLREKDPGDLLSWAVC